MLVNTAYAFLAAEASSDDRALLTAGAVDKDDPTPFRTRLDAWLAEPMGREAAAQAALLTYLRGA